MGVTPKMIGVIPARMHSSRFYGKPLAKILGKEMILWVYENSRQSARVKEIYVATDHEAIASFCEKESVPFVMTSPAHKNCSERSNEVSQKVGADLVVEIQGDEPILPASEIDAFIDQSLRLPSFDVVLLGAEAPLDEAGNPNVVKMVKDAAGRLLYFSRSPIPMNFKSKPARYYKQVGLYLWKAEALKRFSALPVGYLEGIEDTHTLRLVEQRFDPRIVITDHPTIGVDIPGDIQKVENYLAAAAVKS